MNDSLREDLILLEQETDRLQKRLVTAGPRLIRDLVDRHGSLRKAERATGYSPTYFSRIEKGHLVMTPRCYLRLTADPSQK